MELTAIMKEYKNPYRYGVLIGNYIEAINSSSMSTTLYEQKEKAKIYSVSEVKASFKDPKKNRTHRNEQSHDKTLRFYNGGASTCADFNRNLTSTHLNQGKCGVSSNCLSQKQRCLEQGLRKDFSLAQLGDSNCPSYREKSKLVNNLYFGRGLEHLNFNNKGISTVVSIDKMDKSNKLYNSQCSFSNCHFFEKKGYYPKVIEERDIRKCGIFTKTFDMRSNEFGKRK
jgi:hypothetical protein